MPRTRSRYTIPSYIIEVFVLSLFLAIIVNLREQIWRKTALEAAETAYQNARITRETAEEFVTRKLRRKTATLSHIKNSRQIDHFVNSTIEELESEVEHARDDELAKMRECNRLKGIRTGLFW
jgi:hypothetical protein